MENPYKVMADQICNMQRSLASLSETDRKHPLVQEAVTHLQRTRTTLERLWVATQKKG